MIEVTRNNFSYILPQVESTINTADFVSIDTEFTGLCLNDGCRPSLFDTSAQRYQKIKRSVESFSLAQIGITAFKSDPRQNRYNATSFSFYLCPASFSSVDPRFSLQASSIQFLSMHNFDFNKCFKEGLSHLNSHQETEVMKDLKAGFHHMEDNFAFEREIQGVCSQVASWMCHCKQGEFLIVPFKGSSFTSQYAIQREIRSRFPNVWTSVNGFNQIVVENMTDERKRDVEMKGEEWEHTQHQGVLTEMLGFTRVFRMLIESKKPLVGHNLLMDLLFIYSKFHKNLPDTYEQFKREINGLFPVIFDTKHLHHFMKQKFKTLNLKGAYSLEILDQILNSQTAVRLTRMQPAIQKPMTKGTEGTEGNAPHHAGYDSFLCGCVFIRIGHLEHFTTNSEVESLTSPFTFQSYLRTMEKHKNCINVIRASTSYTLLDVFNSLNPNTDYIRGLPGYYIFLREIISVVSSHIKNCHSIIPLVVSKSLVAHQKLDGDDPSCKTPPLLYVSYKGPEKKITSQQLAAEFSGFGTVDIKMMTSTEAIVVTSHFMVSRDILSSFKHHRTIHVTKYRYLIHSRLGKCLIWSAIGAASIGYVSLIWKILKH